MKKLFVIGFICGILFVRYVPLAFSSVPSTEAKSRFAPAPYPLLYRPITIVIIGKDNGAFVEKTLSSVFSQVYENYRILYIDDTSQDGSYELARDLIYESPHLPKVTLIRNEESLGFLANLFRAVESCEEGEIIAVLKGEDWLAHEWVLQRINQYYADPDLWLTYGQYCEYPSFERGVGRGYGEEAIRSSPFVAVPLQTFYAGLFQKIQSSDFLSGGNYISEAAEAAYMIPMLEMARDHWTYIPEVLYISSRHPESYARCETTMQNFSIYAPLKTLLRK